MTVQAAMAARMVGVAERLDLPDKVLRFGVAAMVGRTARTLGETSSDAVRRFAEEMAMQPIALHADAANAQHYEVPADFFGLVLGPRRKYSCCLYRDAETSLDAAELAALEETCAHAALADGQTILELGCGWGSLSLFMAERFPAARIVAVSNSASQRQFIEAEAAARGLGNLRVVTADMNDFNAKQRFDRIVSVEMFEHMANWRTLLWRARSWLAPEGRLFIHVFTHRKGAYRFDHEDEADWIARHFFTGGIMPSHDLIRQFGDLFEVEAEWRWNGSHYARTARDWLANMDRNTASVMPVLRATYGVDAALWRRRWRLFFLATEGLFGFRGGSVWGVSHYRLRQAP